MPEERVIRITYKDGVKVEEEKAIISDEQLADEAEAAALAKADTLIDGITDLASSKVFLKKLCKRLIKKGYLP